MFCAVGQLLATLLGFVEGHLGWMSPFSCIVEEYHDNVAWCHSGRNSLKQGGYCSKMKQGGVGYRDCAMDLMKTGWLLLRIGGELVFYDVFSSNHSGNIYPSFLSVNSFSMCCQILIDCFIITSTVCFIRYILYVELDFILTDTKAIHVSAKAPKVEGSYK